MKQLCCKEGNKKSTNLSIRRNLQTKARGLGINLSATSKGALGSETHKDTKEHWLQENKQLLNNCNALAEKHGLFADKHRGF